MCRAEIGERVATALAAWDHVIGTVGTETAAEVAPHAIRLEGEAYQFLRTTAAPAHSDSIGGATGSAGAMVTGGGPTWGGGPPAGLTLGRRIRALLAGAFRARPTARTGSVM